MGSSIKLNNNMYWDLSSIYGADVYNGIFVIPSGGTVTLNFTSSSQARGFLVTVPNGLEKSGFGIYGFGSNVSGAAIRDIVAASSLTINNSTAFQPKLVSTNAYSIYCLWFARAPLDYTIT